MKHLLLSVLLGLGSFLILTPDGNTIPLYTMASANECDTCHIEPLGWAQADMSERRCTLDCIGCHVSTAGGGLRLADGQYFGKEVLPMYGTRPSSFADPEKYLTKGYPTKGKWDWTDGWRGWWPGKIKHTTIKERYGDITPKPKWNIGGDFRAAFLTQSGNPDSPFVFPMQADLYFLNESVRDLQFYVAAGVQGYKNTDNYSRDEVEISDYFAIKELFLKYRWKYNTWIRAGRFVPRFGWRTPDHTAFTREGLGLNQNFQGTGFDVGYNPNYFYADASLYYTGLDWPGERQTRGLSSTANVGYRAFGWNLGASFHFFDEDTAIEDVGKGDGGIRTLTLGLNGSLNFNPFIYYGEIDFRTSSIPGLEGDEATLGVVAHHEFNYTITRGLFGKFKYDYSDRNLSFDGDHAHRLTFGADIHPYTFLHFELLYRLGFNAVHPLPEFANADISEFLLISHVWF